MTSSASGWTSFFEAQVAPLSRADLDLFPARVVAQHNHLFRLALLREGPSERPRFDELLAGVRGRLRQQAAAELPVAGDWVLASKPANGGGDRACIERVLARRTRISRKLAGRTTEEQVLAANVDAAWVVMALDPDFSLRRLERYLVLIREGGARPVVVLSKADLLPEETVAAAIRECRAVALDAPVLAVSTRTKAGLEDLAATLPAGETIVLLGSSGAGKSTLVNALARDDLVAQTSPVRASDRKGRHTTTHRELIALPDGAFVIDTPGLRELQLWDGAQGLPATFADLDELGARCRFRDCGHGSEPGCAVLGALADGSLAPDRLESWRALQRELGHLEARQDARAALEQKRRLKVIHRAQQQLYKRR